VAGLLSFGIASLQQLDTLVPHNAAACVLDAIARWALHSPSPLLRVLPLFEYQRG